MEEILIAKCKNGDTDAFGKLLSIYKDQLYGYLRRLAGSGDKAEDILQEVLIKIWRGIGKYDPGSKFSAWIFTIARNTALDHLRKEKKQKNFVSISGEEGWEDNYNLESEIENKETVEFIGEAVERLAVKQKEVFLLRQHGNITFREIAEITGQPLNTVLSHMNYAVKKIRTLLREKNVV